MIIRWLFFAGVLAASAQDAAAPVDIQPSVRTEAVADDPDDPAIWVHPSDPERSLILGTNKVKAPAGAIVVFGLDGKIRQTIAGLDRPNNIDVEYGLQLSGKHVDIAVAAERLKGQLHVFRIAPDGSGMSDITSPGQTAVFTDRTGEQAAPMGVSLYRRPRDGAVFAIVASKNGPVEGYLGQYRLTDDGSGRVKATFIRYFGRFSGTGEIEAVAVDDELGYVYYADEGNGIHKYHADPDHRDAAKELAHFGRTGFRADREGIAVYAGRNGKGFIVCTDQIAGSSEYHVYRREGEPGRLVGIVRGGADSTDGLEISSWPLGARFPDGLMVAMNAGGKNFLLYRWNDVLKAVQPGRR